MACHQALPGAGIDGVIRTGTDHCASINGTGINGAGINGRILRKLRQRPSRRREILPQVWGQDRPRTHGDSHSRRLGDPLSEGQRVQAQQLLGCS